MSQVESELSLDANKDNVALIKQRIDDCLLRDQFWLRKQLKHLTSKTEVDTELTTKFFERLNRSYETVKLRESRLPVLDYPDLPVAKSKEDILVALQSSQVVIVAGETGSGKTTQLPKICLEAGFGRKGLIGHTQPRRLAARSVANRIAEELSTPLGEQVGFKIRFTDQSSDNTLVKLMTDGILLAEMQDDRFLNQYEVIIIDEAHERSLNIDFILGYLKTLLAKRNDLKVIITSATIDPERFSKHFNDAPMVLVEGRSYPVEIRYNPLLQESGDVLEQNEAILQAVHELSKEGRGDILVFFSGEREIRDAAEFLNRAKLKHTSILPLYARLSVAEQNKIFQGHSERRIVLATNVAETSLTVPGIRYVIDTGTARISRYSARSKIQRLPIEPISQASANQRAGRCGRVAEGICIRLYDEEDFNSRPEFTDPEILRTNLASVILQLTALRFGAIESFPFVQPPDSRNVTAGIKLLEELQALNNHKKQGLKLTAIGRAMSRLPVDPRYARMLFTAKELDSLNDVMIIVAGLSIQDPRERPREQQQKANEMHSQWDDKDSEFISFLNLWRGFREQQKALSGNQLRKWCQQNMLNYLRMREWQDIVSQLKQAIVGLNWRLSQKEADYEAIHESLVSGLLAHAGFMDKNKEFLGARNNRFFVFPGSALFKKPPKWLVAAELVETSKLYSRVNAKVEPSWLEKYGQHLCKYRYSEPHWSKKAGAVKASESASMLGLPVVNQRNVIYSDIDPVESRQLFIRHALVMGDTKITNPVLQHNMGLIEDVEKLEEKIRRKDLLVDEEVLVDFYEEKLPDNICTEAGFKSWWRKQNKHQQQSWKFDPQTLIKNDTSSANTSNFPDHWHTPNFTLALDYQFNPGAPDDGVSLLVPLPLLNQIPEDGFDWLVPGMRHEIAVYLIKALPKQLRRNFVPAPDYANAALSDIAPEQGAFLAQFCAKLIKMTGTVFESEIWQETQLPEHLQFNFKILDGEKLLGQGRDLNELKQRFAKQLSKTLQKVAKPGLEKQNVTEWSFDDLPESWTDNQANFAVKAYPALVRDGNKVHLKLFDTAEKAIQEHRKGLRQLIIKQLPSPIKYLHERLPNKSKLGLYFNPFGQIKTLIEDCIAAVVDDYILSAEQQSDIRLKKTFEALTDAIRGDVNQRVLDVAIDVEKGLTQAHKISKQLKGSTPLNMINAFADVKGHLGQLVYPGFVSDIGVARLKDWNRYIAGLVRRLEKIPVDPIKDRSQQLVIEKVMQRFQACLNKIPKNQLVPDDLAQVRWHIEELRVSLFAQQLGTNMPISSKRIENYLDKF